MKTRARWRAAVASVGCIAVAGLIAVPILGGAGASTVAAASAATPNDGGSTMTPIKHVVVIFQENVSFDHYFGTYPNATNSSGQPFNPAPNTPTVNGLSGTLLTNNPNNVNPRRLDPSNINDVLTCDQNHSYTAEQTAFDNGAMDKFPASVGTVTGKNPNGQPCQSSDTMNYYDGNTATGMWNYAQHFAMSDNSFGTTFGPSAPGAINLASGDTGGVDASKAIRGALPVVPNTTSGDLAADGNGGYSLIGDAQPYYDDCSTRDSVAMTGTNVGDQLNSAGLSWGFFQGGFQANSPYTGPTDSAATYSPLTETGNATCTTIHPVGAALGGTGTTGAKPFGVKGDYIEHHEPFQYYASTANPHHVAPASLDAIGTDTASPGQFNTANHQYDTSNFDALVSAIRTGSVPASNLPAVTFLKAPGYEDGHAAYSDPIDEQKFVVNEINSLEKLPTWSSTAVIISYDDSDGFYDHVYSGVTNPSHTAADTLTGIGACGTSTTPLANQQGRCGYGPRLPLVVISPYAKSNYVSHTLTDQSSILKFIEFNWSLGSIAGSAATAAGSLNDMFDFNNGGSTPAVTLSAQTGQVTSITPPPGTGYREVTSDGTVSSFGTAQPFGSLTGPLNKPIVGMTSTPDGGGYWLVAADGGVFSFGDAAFLGSEGGQHLNRPVVGMASTPDGGGYWLVAADGGIFTFGDAAFFGSEGGQHLNRPVVGMASTPDGGGYWLVAADGGIFTFGDAGYHGSEGDMHLNRPVVGMASTPDGGGYWLVAADGGIFTFGDAAFFGSLGGQHLNKPVVGMAASTDGTGYWLFARDGGVFTFGQAQYEGSIPGQGITVDNVVGGASP
jgi:phospholipase C